ncbi:MAG: asparagine synthase (glutamine-hydrolyzing) [Thermoanaerobaculia bacterium]
MCGIAGIVAFPGVRPPTADQIARMCDTLVHRGPDSQGSILEGPVGLGMRRLSIIDLAGGDQPLFNEDRSVSLVFNGEIYNYRELRERLEGQGHIFATATDGEVIAHLWEEYGEAFPTHLNGMFSIALHDKRQRRVVLVRDRLGIKPLFLTLTGDHMVLGSEVKSLLASGLVQPRVDLNSLAQFLAWEYVPGPATLFAGIRKLDPGSLLILSTDSGEVRETRWWQIPASEAAETELSTEEWIEAVDDQIRRSVQRQLVSDVPLGAFLSGGVDSSLVVAHMGPARTFSIGFADPSYDETAWSAKVADHLGVSHRIEILEPQIGDLFEELLHYFDDPIGDFSIFPTYLVSKLAREEVAVVLTGDGGDELFGGYETYVAQQAARTWQSVPGPLRSGILEPWMRSLRPRAAKKGLVNKIIRFAEGLAQDPKLEHARWRLFASTELQNRLLTPEARSGIELPIEGHILRLEQEAGSRPPLDRNLYVDARSYLVDNCLVKMDRMSMACSLEARVPLLDHDLVELAFQVPPELKVRNRETKVLLKKVAARHVPRDCVYRPKEGFSIPIKHWLRDELRPLMEDLLSHERLGREGIFAIPEVERLKREHIKGQANHSHVLWSMMVFEDWGRRWGAL